MSQSMALTNWHGPVWANYQNKINSNFYYAIQLTVLYHLIYSCSLSHKRIQFLDSLKLLNSFLHSSTLALALLGAAVWWQQGSLTSGDSAGGAVTSGQEVETWFWKQRQDGPRPATQELRASLSRYRTVLEHDRYWQTVDAGWNVCCVPLLDDASSGRLWAHQPCHWQFTWFWGHWANSQSFSLPVWTRQTAPTVTGTNSQTGCVSKPVPVRPLRSWGHERAQGECGPAPLATDSRAGRDRKMPDGLQSRSVLCVGTRTIRIVYFKTQSGPACAIWHTGPVGNSDHHLTGSLFINFFRQLILSGTSNNGEPEKNLDLGAANIY